MLLKELPFNLPGRIFAGVMPFGLFDPDGDSLTEFRVEDIQVIVLLAPEDECLRIAGKNLLTFYKKEGFQVVYLPIEDFSVPSMEDLDHAANLAIEHAKAGQNIAVHCQAGIGRTGLFMTYLAKKLFSLSGEKAIQWVRKYIPRAVESAVQRKLLEGDLPEKYPSS